MLWWDKWNKYTPNPEVYGKYTDTKIPLLFLNGELDPQTPIGGATYAVEKFGAEINVDGDESDSNRFFYSIPNTVHDVMYRSHMRLPSISGQFETCGFIIMHVCWKMPWIRPG